MKYSFIFLCFLALGLVISCHKKSVDEVVFDETLQPGLVADFSIDHQNGSVNEKDAVLLTNKSKNAVSYEWSLGNGVVSTEPTPSFAYQMCGNYTITLKVKDNKGVVQQTSKNITVLCIFGGVGHDF
ncbi:MAG TPA: PKD domain-containing protein [Saprospiraceae bacterium]|nr:PKD domain-containing protein [Saprospiraceae bacterium]